MSRVWWVWLGVVGCGDEKDGERDCADCPGAVDDDLDDDGFAADDCDDGSAAVHPGADEVPYDRVDQDCVDGDLVDVDGDGSDAEIAGGDDCADDDPDLHPGAEEIPYDDVDQDCSGADLVDIDGDGFRGLEGGGEDCDDLLAEVHPGAVDLTIDGVDQDCSTVDGLLGVTFEIAPTGIGASGADAIQYIGFNPPISLITVIGGDASSVHLRFAAPLPDGTQNLCAPTAEILAAPLAANGDLEGSGVELPLRMIDATGDIVLVVSDGALLGRVVDGALTRVRIQGRVDMRTLVPWDEQGPPCGSGYCEACPDGEVQCMSTDIILDPDVMPTSAVAVVERTVGEIAVDPACP